MKGVFEMYESYVSLLFCHKLNVRFRPLNQPLSGKHGDLNIPEKPRGDFDCYEITEKTNFLDLSTFLIVQSVLGL